jgi:hypothetical protein
MEGNIWECGKTGNKKDKEYMWAGMDRKEKAFGRMGIELSGWMNDYFYFF